MTRIHKIIVSNRSALLKKYTEKELQMIEDAVADLIESDRTQVRLKRGSCIWTTRHGAAPTDRLCELVRSECANVDGIVCYYSGQSVQQSGRAQAVPADRSGQAQDSPQDAHSLFQLSWEHELACLLG